MTHRKEKKLDSIHLHQGNHLLRELLHAHLALLNLFSREVGITPARLKLFHEFLHADQDGIGLSDLALRLGVTPALVTRQVKELEREGLVRRRSDSRDGRRSFIYLSAKGKCEVLNLHERAHRFEAALIKDMNPEDVAVAINILSSLSEKLESWRRTGRYLLNADQVEELD